MRMSQKVLIATPVNEPTLVIGYVQSLLESQTAFRRAGIGFDIVLETQCSLVISGRNSLVAQFLASDATDMVFIDSDTGWKADDLVKLVSHPVPLVAGVSRTKTPTLNFAVEFGDLSRIEGDPQTKLLRANGVGAAFMRLRRDCLETMISAYPELRIERDGRTQYALFDTSIENGKMLGEDYTFCRRWKAIGGDIWIDPEINLSHYGTVPFSGSLASVMKRNEAE